MVAGQRNHQLPIFVFILVLIELKCSRVLNSGVSSLFHLFFLRILQLHLD